MWHVTAEEDIKCSECLHTFRAGSVCLSQMPAEMPDNFRRSKYENFCIKCPDCNPKASQREKLINPCYARWLNHWYTRTARTLESTACAYCNQDISKGTRTFAQKIYAWPALETDVEAENTTGLDTGVTATIVGRVAKSGASNWRNLSPETQHLFQTRGLGRNLGSRTPTMGKRLYESIPKAIRDEGESAVLEWLKGKHVSHIKSVAKAPSLAKRPSNILIENASKNMARGSRNMTASEVNATKEAMRSSAIKTGMKSAASRAALTAALLEAPIAGIENYLHHKRGRKSGNQAVKDATKSTVTACGTAAATTVAVKAVALTGVSLSLGPLAVPVAIGAGTIFAAGTIHRIAKANRRDLPLDEYFLFFCKNEECKTKFAQNLTTFEC